MWPGPGPPDSDNIAQTFASESPYQSVAMDEMTDHLPLPSRKDSAEERQESLLSNNEESEFTSYTSSCNDSSSDLDIEEDSENSSDSHLSNADSALNLHSPENCIDSVLKTTESTKTKTLENNEPCSKETGLAIDDSQEIRCFSSNVGDEDKFTRAVETNSKDTNNCDKDQSGSSLLTSSSDDPVLSNMDSAISVCSDNRVLEDISFESVPSSPSKALVISDTSECSSSSSDGCSGKYSGYEKASNMFKINSNILDYDSGIVFKQDSKRKNCQSGFDSNFNNNISINEFRDTIGICEVRPVGNVSVFDVPQNDFNDTLVYKYSGLLNNDVDVVSSVPNNSKPSNDRGRSFLSLNTQIMEILTDLDDVLDRSLIEDSTDSDEAINHVQYLLAATENFDDKQNSTDSDDISPDIIELRDRVNGNLTNVKSDWVDIKRDLSDIKEELTLLEAENFIISPEISLYEESESDENAATSVETIPVGDLEEMSGNNTETTFVLTIELNEAVIPNVALDCSREQDIRQRENANEDSESTLGRNFRRDSMRLARPLQMPAASPSPPPELSLSALLFLQSQQPERYSTPRASSAGAAPAQRGRRALPPRRCSSLHVAPRRASSPPATTSVVIEEPISPIHRISNEEITASPVRLETDDEGDCKESWPIRGGASLALVTCCLGAYNICRFSLLTLHFGTSFVLQFALLSALLGAPLLALAASLGGALRAGPLRAWRVAPLCRGLGAALLLAHAFMAAYYAVGLAWLLVYFRDSFVPQHGRYRWAEPFNNPDNVNLSNDTSHLPLSIPWYLREVVLQRGTDPSEPSSSGLALGGLHFQLVFHLTLVWVAVCLFLSKGLQSYGKVVFVVTVAPMAGLLAVCVRLLWVSPSTLHGALPYSNWGEFFINSKSWSAAAGEAFLTWGLLAPTAWSLFGLSTSKFASRPVFSLIPVLILTPLLLGAGVLIAGACHHIIRENGYYYATTSYEQPSWSIFLERETPANIRHSTHHSSLLGVSIARPGADPSASSGFQPLRLATELMPAALALVSTKNMSAFWAALFYLSLLLLGLAQLTALCLGIVTGIADAGPRVLRKRHGTLALCWCALVLLLSLPLGMSRGLELAHLMDYIVVGAWWQCLLQVAVLGAIFLLRGRPYTADALASYFLPPPSSLAPLIAFTWNIVLPVAMIALCVVEWRAGRYGLVWGGSPLNHGAGNYWDRATRAAIVCMQLGPLLLVPIVAIGQTFRYISKGPPDILDRIQLLYRPRLDNEGRVIRPEPPAPTIPPSAVPMPSIPDVSTVPEEEVTEDPPPKYTPPPSYSTATGARIAKMLRNSIRRSIRRVQRRLTLSTGEGSGASRSLQLSGVPVPSAPPPPHYSQLTEIPHMLCAPTPSISTQLDIPEDISSFISSHTLPQLSRMYRSFNTKNQRTKSDIVTPKMTATEVGNLLRAGGGMRASLRARTLPVSRGTSLLQNAEPLSLSPPPRRPSAHEEDNSSAI